MRLKCGIHFVRMLEGPSVDAVVRRIESAFREPSDITCLEPAGSNGLEWAVPVKGLASNLSLVRIKVFSESLALYIPWPTTYPIHDQ